MTLDQLANMSEIIGATIVVVTLVFLTLQIRQNTKALRSASIQTALQAEIDIGSTIIENADVWDKVVTSAPLGRGAETRRAIGLYNLFMIETENRYHQHYSGYLASQSWEGRRGTLARMVALPVYKAWRSSVGGLSHSADFLELLDDLAKEQGG